MPTQIAESVTGAAKAAMFLMGIGDELSVELLRQLDSNEIRRVNSEISALQAVPPAHMVHVFREFESLTESSRYFAKGGSDCARRLIEQALGAESARKLLDTAEPEPQGQANAPAASPELEILQNTDPRQLAAFLRAENPQTIALVLANMPPDAAGALLQSLPAELQSQAALRMASLERVSPDVFRKITQAIGSKLKAIRQVSKSDGIRLLAALLNRIEPARAEEILGELEQENQSAAGSVRNLMFTFDDIVNIDKSGMKALVGRLDQKVLTMALKGAAKKLREHFTQCMSQRAAEMLAEDMEVMGPVRIRDVQAAQQQILATVRSLQQQGAIANSSGGGEEYVE